MKRINRLMVVLPGAIPNATRRNTLVVFVYLFILLIVLSVTPY